MYKEANSAIVAITVINCLVERPKDDVIRGVEIKVKVVKLSNGKEGSVCSH